MIPQLINDDISLDFEIVQHPTNTWRITFDGKPSAGMVTGLDAMVQTIHMILTAERFKWSTLSWNYGIELERCFGIPDRMLLQALLRQSISEALLQDDRITSVEDFEFEKNRTTVIVSFTVVTTVGTIDERMEVAI